MKVRDSIVWASFVVAASGVARCPAPKPLDVACRMEKDQIDVVRLDLARGQATLLSVSAALAGTGSRHTPPNTRSCFSLDRMAPRVC